MNSNMDNLEFLSDSELRLRLIQFGFPNLPVTATTRKLLIKKLRMHTENQKSQLRRETSYATRYSSGEESDNNDIKKRKNRATVSGIPQATRMAPPSTNVRPKRSVFAGTPPRNERVITPVRNTSYTNISASESEEETDNNNSRQSSARISPYSTISSRLSNQNSPAADYIDSIIRKRYPNSSPTSNYTPPLSSPPLRDTTNTNGHRSFESDRTDDSPYTSDFTKRLLSLRGETQRDSIIKSTAAANAQFQQQQQQQRKSRYFNNSSYNDREIVHHAAAEPTKEQPSVPVNVALTNLLNKLDEYYGIKQTFVPCVLLTALMLFLTLIVFMYMTISPDVINTLNPRDTTYTLCSTNDYENFKPYQCIRETDLESALDLLKIIAPELQRRVEYTKCVDKTSNFIMSSKEVIDFAFERNHNIHVNTVLRDLPYLVLTNPQWRISNVDDTGSLLSAEQFNENNSFAILNPRLPFSCVIYNKLQNFFMIVGIIGLIIILYFSVKFVLNIYWEMKKLRQQKINRLVSDIINSTIEQAGLHQSQPQQSRIVLNHLRDKLIPLEKRKELEWAWIEAIKFIETKESRINFEVATINGEDFKTIRWIDTVSSGLAGSIQNRSNGGKRFQSPAFENQKKIMEPPTPCLKIRNMFESYEVHDPNLKSTIQDAILEKVGKNCKIYEIQLDENTCCVYVRCATEKDAGIVHDEINGWWFDKRLVSIKFIRLERYIGRFPRSYSGPSCLRPSNNQNLSMTQCYNNLDNENDLDDDDDEEPNRY